MNRLFFPSRRNLALFFWFGFAVWFSILFLLSSRPSIIGDSPPGAVIPIDKAMHFLYFFSGGVCLMLALINTFALRGWKLILLGAVIMSLVGVSDEFHQSFVPGRSGDDPFDWSADTTGGLAAALVVGLIHGQLSRKTRP